MRHYLAKEKRVYTNNIIVTLPSDSSIEDENGRKIITKRATKITPVTIQIPERFNAIGIIDGQHRVYSYHEGFDDMDHTIGILRKKQHLLVTGILYPENIRQEKKQEFEAKLFLEINDKQKPVKGDLKQAIERIINPFSSIVIAKAVISRLAASGPLMGLLEVHFYDTSKIKTTSIVSYGLKHIVGLDAENSLYKIWNYKGKDKAKHQITCLKNYIDFCEEKIAAFIDGFKINIPDNLWTSDKKASRVLTTTTINGLIFCLRLLIKNNKLGNFEYYKRSFENMDIDFRANHFNYKSSHWKDLGEMLYSQCF